MKIKNIPNFHTFFTLLSIDDPREYKKMNELIFFIGYLSLLVTHTLFKAKIDNRSVKFKRILNAKTSQLLSSPSVPIINARNFYCLS